MEKKFFEDYEPPSALASNTWVQLNGTPGCANAITQGDGEQNRDGRKVVVTNLNSRIHLMAGANTKAIRVIILIDRQTNGTSATVADFLEGTNFLTYRNLPNTQRFQFLADFFVDEKYLLGSPVAGSDNVVEKYFKLDLPVQYSASTGSISDITDNSIQMWAYSDGDASTYEMYNRVRFVG